MSVPVLPNVFTISEAAKVARVSESTMRKEIKAGHIHTRHIAGCRRLLSDELNRWLHDYGEAP